jgi:transposase-like protein
MNMPKKSPSKAPLYSLFDFQKEYGTDMQCRDYLFRKKFPEGFKCSRCGHTEYSFVRRHKLFECKKCLKQHSVTVNTIFSHTKLPLHVWFLAIYIVSQNASGVSASTIQKLTGVKKYETAWNMLQKIRKSMGDRDDKYTIEGIIEFDDGYFGGPSEGKRGRGADGKTNVVVAVSKTEDGKPKYLSMKTTEDIKTDTIDRAMADKIKKEKSELHTDGLPAMLALEKKGYKIKKTVIGDPKEASEIFKWVHTAISNAKGTYEGVHHGVSGKRLQLYLNEFCYKFNRRYFGGDIFKRMLIATADSSSVRRYEF